MAIISILLKNVVDKTFQTFFLLSDDKEKLISDNINKINEKGLHLLIETIDHDFSSEDLESRLYRRSRVIR